VSHAGNQPGRCPYVAAFQAGTTGDPLPSRREGASKPAILDLVQQVTADGATQCRPRSRSRVFDYDGTLCSEKPMLIQCDLGWPDKVITPHVHGDGMEAR
jgi:hypothetical protein